MLKKAIIFLVVLVALVLAAAVAVHLVLGTDLPRRLALSQLREQTGLNIQAADLETTWGGRSVFEDFTVALPLEDDPFVEIPRLEVSHTGVLKLIIGRPLTLDDVAVHEALVVVRQMPGGEWNVQQAATIVQRTLAQREEDAAPPRDEPLPAVRIANATVVVQPLDRDAVRYEGVAVNGHSPQPLQWAFEAAAAPYAQATGRVMLHANYDHEIAFEVDEIAALLEPYGVGAPAPLQGAGTWRGRVVDGRLDGRLQLTGAGVGDAATHGEVLVQMVDGQYVVLQPRGLTIEHPMVAGDEPVHLAQGRVEVGPAQVAVRGLQVSALATTATVHGTWDREADALQAQAVWEGQTPGGPFTHRGRAMVDLDGLLGERREGRLDATIDLTTPAGALAADVEAQAVAWGLDEAGGTIALPRLRWSDEQGEVIADGVELTLAYEAPVLRLSELAIPYAATLDATGRVDTRTLDWTVVLDADAVDPPRLAGEPFDLAVEASGDRNVANFSQLRLARDTLLVEASGSYMPRRRTPLLAHARVSAELPPDGLADDVPADGPDAVPAADGAADGAADATASAPSGRLDAAVDVSGTLQPQRSLRYEGQLIAEGLPVLRGRLDRLVLPWRGTIDDEAVAFDAGPITLLDGTWQVQGVYGMDTRDLELDVSGESADLDALLALADVPVELNGTVRTDLDVALPNLSVDRLQVNGAWAVDDITTADGAVVADRAVGQLRTQDETLRLEELVLEVGEGSIAGSAAVNVRTRDRVQASLTAQRWPVTIDGAAMQAFVNGQADVLVDLADRTAQGDVQMQAEVHRDQRPVGVVQLQGAVDGRTVRVPTLMAEVAGGTMNGAFTLPIDNWVEVQGELAWESVDLALAAELLDLPQEELVGRVSGTLIAEPAGPPVADQGVQVRLESRLTGGAYRAVELRDARFLLVVDGDRYVLDSSTFSLAGGEVELWGRTSLHDDERHVHAVVTLDGLDVGQLLRTVQPDTELVAGRISGRATVGGYVEAPHRAFGEGRFEVTQADLGSVPVFSLLYSLLNLDFDTRQATGEGQFAVRLEGDALEVSRLRYFNRGTEVIGSMTVQNVFAGAESPLGGLAVASVQPFRDLDLPLVGDLDRLVKAVQGQTASVRIGGTLGEPDPEPVPFADVSSSVRRLLRATFAGE